MIKDAPLYMHQLLKGSFQLSLTVCDELAYLRQTTLLFQNFYLMATCNEFERHGQENLINIARRRQIYRGADGLLRVCDNVAYLSVTLLPPQRKLSLARHILPQFIVAPDPNVGEICAERSRHTLRVDLGEQCSLSTRACKKNLHV